MGGACSCVEDRPHVFSKSQKSEKKVCYESQAKYDVATKTTTNDQAIAGTLFFVGDHQTSGKVREEEHALRLMDFDASIQVGF